MSDTPRSTRIPSDPAAPGPGADGGTAADRAYAHVKERILSGDLEGGELISEGEIADGLQMSRTPVREAFLRLQTEGWMRLYPKRGAAITPIKPREVDEVIEARALVEAHAVASVAADPARAADLAAALTMIIDRQQRAAAADDLAGFAVADADFHGSIAAASDNDLLINFYLGLRDRQRRMTRDSVQRSPGAQDRILDQHRELVDLIAAQDADGFAARISEHLDDIHRH
ncbi:putative transcriptional regulator, GntR family protein [Microlunatus endophyticus]|uniref:Transcriptional regulator, GntR family protein n=1 Tax=Microlunatus endophyticus TaxID=1716077 RepID=A0A917VZS1_9ACTN|nr:GntR family transcriptional regulator [Microlunatus endophyticus]GGL49165.1 putative transcriptional regulator, GntR family protein [Microlunatus endophyticus]